MMPSVGDPGGYRPAWALREVPAQRSGSPPRGGGWNGARLFAADVDTTPGRLVRDSVFPSIMPEADAGGFVAKA
jgi:hypothetical protein